MIKIDITMLVDPFSALSSQVEECLQKNHYKIV